MELMVLVVVCYLTNLTVLVVVQCRRFVITESVVVVMDTTPDTDPVGNFWKILNNITGLIVTKLHLIHSKAVQIIKNVAKLT
jgi:hypothetical protein